MSAPFTFSEWDRVHECPGSAALPRDPEVPNDDSEAGQTRHTFLFIVGQTGDITTALGEIPAEHRAGCDSMDLASLPVGPPWHQEAAFAVDTRDGSAQWLGTNIQRAYPDLTPHHVCGTADSIQHRLDGVVEAWDFKGWWSRVTPKASSNRQLRAQFIAGLGWAHGPETAWKDGPDGYAATGGLIPLSAKGQDKRDGPIRLDVLDLGAALEEMRQDVQRVHDASALVRIGTQPSVKEGPHCAYCPAILHCPAKGATYAQLKPQGAVHPVELAMMARIREEPGAVKAWTSYVKHMIGEIEGQLAIHAVNVGGFKLENGRMYGPHMKPVQVIDGGAAWSAIKETWGEKHAELAVKMVVTQTGITAASRLAKEGKTVKTIVAGERLIEEILRANGGWKTVEKSAVGEYDPK